MRVSNTASAVRASLTPSEIDDLDWLVRGAQKAGAYIPSRAVDLVATLKNSASCVRARQAAKRAEKDYAKHCERERRSRESYFMIGEHYSVTAGRADYADISSDPDFRQWVDLLLQEVMNKPIPAQCEIRRNVWCVRVVRLQPGALSDIVGMDCTETDDVGAVRETAARLIAAYEAAQVPA